MLPESQSIECWMQPKGTIFKKNVQIQDERLNKHSSITWYPDTLYNTYTFYMTIQFLDPYPWVVLLCRGDTSADLVSFYPKRNNSCMLYEFVGIDKIWTEIKHCKMWRRPNKSSFQIFEAFTNRKLHILLFLLKSCCNRHHVVFAR